MDNKSRISIMVVLETELIYTCKDVISSSESPCLLHREEKNIPETKYPAQAAHQPSVVGPPGMN
jgi:hypothetical protein